MVTIIRAAPAACAGIVTDIDVALLEVTVAAVPPNVTAVGVARLVPVMTTVVPPVIGPELGLILVMVGADMVDQDNRALSLKTKKQ